MIFEENINYYKEMKVPVRVIKNIRRESINPQKGMNFGLFKQFLKRAGRILLILAFLSAQVYLASAFEAHVVNVTAHICSPSETRTMGFWKNHPNVYNPHCLPQYLGDDWINFVPEVKEVFENANADVMRDMLKGQLLAMKFNIDCFGIDPYEGEEFGGMKLNELVEWADNLLQDPNSTRGEQELVKDLLDYANNLHQIRYCSTEPSWLSSALAQKSEKEEEPTPEELAASLQVVFTEEEPPAEEPPVEELPLAPEPEPYCGDGNIDDGEECDDGNIEDGDGCSVNCILEVGEGSKPEPPVEPGPSCGDGIIDEGEQCDDGNIEDGDGCSVNCILEVGEGSEPEPPVEPGPSCGDGIIDEGEQCDAGENNGVECVPEYDLSCDYCSLNCETITITGPYCGDGNLDESYEECDDGNTEDGDGCSVSCATEEVLTPVTECEPEAQQVCSTGLLGICEAGTQICDLEGFWGECLQDNQLIDEVCNNELDDNCDGNIDCGDSSCLEDESCLPPVEQ